MQEFSKKFRYNLIHMPECCFVKSRRKMFEKGTVWTLDTPILFDLWQYSVHRLNAISERKMVKSRRLENALLAIRNFQISIKGRCNICKFDLETMEDGRSMTTFYYCSVNHQSVLQRNTFSAIIAI